MLFWGLPKVLNLHLCYASLLPLSEVLRASSFPTRNKGHKLGRGSKVMTGGTHWVLVWIQVSSDTLGMLHSGTALNLANSEGMQISLKKMFLFLWTRTSLERMMTLYMCICLCLCVFICAHIYAHIYTHIHECVHKQAFRYTCIKQSV